MRKTLTGDIGRCHCIVCQLQNWLLFSQILQKRIFVQANFILFFPSFLCLIFKNSVSKPTYNNDNRDFPK